MCQCREYRERRKAKTETDRQMDQCPMGGVWWCRTAATGSRMPKGKAVSSLLPKTVDWAFQKLVSFAKIGTLSSDRISLYVEIATVDR